MIDRDRPSALRLFFVWRGSIVAHILPQIFGFALYASIIVVATNAIGFDLSKIGVALSRSGITLSIYLSFRNSAAYDRWWEARRLWGQLVAESRTLHAPPRRCCPTLRFAVASCFASSAFVTCYVASCATSTFGRRLPRCRLSAILDRGASRWADLAETRRSGALDPIGHRILEERLANLTLIEAGCERISGTPLPFAYTLLLHRTAYLVCLLLPFGLVGFAGWATPLFTALIAYTFFGLDRISEELEDPFGTEANDLALDSLCRTCEISVFEAIGRSGTLAAGAARISSVVVTFRRRMSAAERPSCGPGRTCV